MSNMIDKLYKFMMFIFSASVIVSFFLPWVSVNTQPVGKVATVLTALRQAPMLGIRESEQETAIFRKSQSRNDMI